jgi:hypothetical protein
MQLVVNFENPKHLDLLKMLFEQLQISNYTVFEDDEDDLEDAYLLKLANEARNEPTTSWEQVKKELNLNL